MSDEFTEFNTIITVTAIEPIGENEIVEVDTAASTARPLGTDWEGLAYYDLGRALEAIARGQKGRVEIGVPLPRR